MTRLKINATAMVSSGGSTATQLPAACGTASAALVMELKDKR
jgi:hypothetical protein